MAALGTGAKEGAGSGKPALAVERGTVNGIKRRAVRFVLKANNPPDNAFKPLIKRTPSARPYDAETGLSLVRYCSSERIQVASQWSRVV